MTELSTAVVAAGRLSAQPQPTFAVGELTIRPWRPADAPALVRAHDDPDIRYWHIESVDLTEAEARIAQWPALWSREERIDWAVTDGCALVGRVGLKGIQLWEGICEVAYWVVPEARGRRVAPRVVTAVSDWAFGDVGFHRIELVHSVRNERSCRVAAAAGFALEGTLRECGNHSDGWHDMHLHARLAGDQPG